MNTMNAVVFSTAGSPMAVERIPIPKPRAGEVLYKVEACGVCHTDLHVMKGDVAFPSPAVLGHETAGEVVELGRGVDNLSVGDKVVTSFIMPCGECRYCREGRDDLCSTFFSMNRLQGVLYDGTSRLSRADGSPLAMYSMAGLAEYAVTPATAAFRRDEGLDTASAATLGCAFLTAYGAVKHRAMLQEGETVAVIGTGGVGSAVVQVAAAFGASRIIAVDLSARKLELAKQNKATDGVDASAMDPVAAVIEFSGGGVDVCFEAIGLARTFVQATEMVCDGGRMVAVGIGARDATAPIEITRTVRRVITVMGSYGGRARVDMPEVLRLAEAGQINPQLAVTQTFALDHAQEAYDLLDRGQIEGRAVIVM